MRFVQKYWTLLSLFLLVLVSTSMFFGQNISAILALCILFLGLVMSIIFIVQRNRKVYLQGKITQIVFVRNVVFEIFGILLAMALAGLLGRYIAQVATEQIANELAKLIAGILIGPLAGIGIGILVKRTSGWLINL